MTDTNEAGPRRKGKGLTCGRAFCGGVALVVGSCLLLAAWERLTSLQQVAEYDARASHVLELAYAPDGRTLVGRCELGLRAWAVADGALVGQVNGPHASDPCLAVGPGGLVAFGRELRQLPDLREVRTLAAPAVAFAPDGQTIAAIDGDAVVLVRVSDGAIAARLAPPWPAHPPATAGPSSPRGAEGFRASVSAAGGKLLLAVAGHGHARVWSLPGGELVRDLEAPARVAALAFSPDGAALRLIGARESGLASLRAWSVPEGRPLLSREQVVSTGLLTRHTLLAAALHPDGGRYAMTTPMSDIDVRGPDGDQLREGTVRPANAAVAAAFSPDGARLATGGWDGLVHIWAIE